VHLRQVHSIFPEVTVTNPEGRGTFSPLNKVHWQGVLIIQAWQAKGRVFKDTYPKDLRAQVTFQ
jgi:hypothetical protein